MAEERASSRQPARPQIGLDDIVREYHTRYRTVGQSVVAILREAILHGAFEPGDRLVQEELAARIGVSRIPVRTALLQLEVEGLVAFEPHRGATVRRMSAERISEIYKLRVLLETHALRGAAGSLSDEEKADVVDEAVVLDRASEGVDFLEQRICFYRKLYDARRNPVLVELIEQLRVSIGRHRLGIRMGRDGFSHEALARAVQLGDPDGAEAVLRKHLFGVRDRMVASLGGPSAAAAQT